MEFATAALEHLRTAFEKRRQAVLCLCAASGGFLTSASPLLSSASPFGLAFAGAVGAPQALWASAGAVLGYLTQTDPTRSLRYLASLVLLMGLRWGLAFVEKERLALYTPLLAALCVGVTGFAVAFSGGDPSYGWAMAACETAICAAAGILFAKALRVLAQGEALFGSAGVCTGILLAVLLTGAAQLTGGVFPLPYAAAVWLILVQARCGRRGQAVLTGSACAVAAALSGRDALFPVLVSASLAAEVFSPLGAWAAPVSFLTAGVLALLSGGMVGAVLPFSAAVLLAGGALLLTPLSLLRPLGLTAGGELSSDGGRQLEEYCFSRLRLALSDAAHLACEIAEKLEALRCDRAQELLAAACRRVCRSCPRSAECWQRQYDLTQEACGALFFGNGRTVPAAFSCSRMAALEQQLCRAGEEYRAQRLLREQAEGLKSVSAEQFSGMEKLLASLGATLSGFARVRGEEEREAAQLLSSLGAAPLFAACYLGREDRPLLLAEIPLQKLPRLDPPEKIAAALSELLHRPLAPARVQKTNETACLTWEEAPPYRAETCFRQQSADGRLLCGDRCGVFHAQEGSLVLLLSDGMGTGKSAALDSAMTVSLLESLLSAGAGFEAALSIVNAALLSRGDERLCTVDAAMIDLYAPRLTCRKAGAAPSYLCRGGRVRRLEQSALPIGVLGGAEAASSTLALQEGDVLVLVSDGLTDDGGEWIPSQIAAFSSQGLEALCENLLATAKDRRAGARADDCTVLAMRLLRA